MCPDQRPAKSPLSHKQGIWQGNEHRSSLEGHDDGSQDHFLAPFSRMAACPSQKKKKLGTVKTGQHGDYAQMEDIMIGCAVTPFPLFFKLCGGLIKSASSLQPLMLQGSLIKSHSQKHTIHQLRTNFVDVNG